MSSSTASAASASESLSAAAQRERYEADGYLILRNVFSAAEIAEVEAEANQLWWRKELIDTNNIRCRWQNHIETGECTFECFDPIIDLGSTCGRIATDRRILDPLASIYGADACLFKDKLIYKPPGVKGYGLHQDFIGWKSFPRTFVTVLVPIDAADRGNGATEVFPGYHRQGYLSPEDGMYHELPLETIDESRGVALDLRPGDIALFGCFTPHRSASNRSDRWRRQLYLSYNSIDDGGPQRDAHYQEFHSWLKDRYAEYGKTEVYFR
jgi:ectoine hydroxylase-related dioxygenase (phytanoyl-CoA dioxygenase family)